jgi:hypothetical protein
LKPRLLDAVARDDRAIVELGEVLVLCAEAGVIHAEEVIGEERAVGGGVAGLQSLPDFALERDEEIQVSGQTISIP